MKFWTKEEFEKFLEFVRDKPLSYYAFKTLFWTGIRIGELLALTIKDFDPVNKTLTINKSYQRIKGRDVITDPKTPKSNRVITLPEFMVHDLNEYIGMLYGIMENDRLFHTTKSYLEHEMIRGCELSGVKKIRLHDLRHPYVKPKTKKYESFYVPSGSEKLPVQLNNLSFKACLLSYSSRYEKVLCNIFYLNPVFRKDIHFLNQ